jgi:hypothetical protein
MTLTPELKDFIKKQAAAWGEELQAELDTMTPEEQVKFKEELRKEVAEYFGWVRTQ